jgi:DNA helicase-2/ATP-dependent DNA helicase PcrA
MASISDVVEFDGRIAKVAGPVRSGKTEALVQKCAALLAAGAAADGILVVCASTEACRAFAARLEAAAGAAARGVRVQTMHDACTNVLITPEAQAACGRNPRTLNRFEYNFLLEDMKTLGQPIRRLKGMMAHYKRALADMLPADQVARAGEEEIVFEHMQKLLKFEGAMLEEELAWVCAGYLQSEAGAGAAHAFAHVFVDDFQNLSAAEQRCACLLAESQLIVAGCAQASVATVSAYPSAVGFENFDKLRKNVTLFELDGAFGGAYALNFARSVLAHDEFAGAGAGASDTFGTPGEQDAKITYVKWKTPEEEFANLTKHIRVLADETKETPYCKTAVVAPNKRWAKALSKMLAKRGFELSSCAWARVGGDPRDMGRARAMLAYTRLNLLAAPADGAAWRTWCGYGNYLCNSDAWASFMTYAEGAKLSIVEALDAVAAEVAAGTEPFLRAGAIAERYAEGRAFIEKYAGATGFAALKFAGASDCAEFAGLEAGLVGDETAAQIFAIAQRMQYDVVFSDNKRALRVVSYAELAGLEFDYVYAAGLVDGFVPTRDAFEVVSTDEARADVMNAQRRAFAAGVAKATCALTLSTFQTSNLELAEITKMQVVRIRSVDDARVATLRPACFIAEGEAWAPSSTSGQALLSNEAAD